MTSVSHSRSLEAESIYILREAAAEFSHPALLYSIGKDSSVLVRLAKKAFWPGRIPFTLLHIDTGYKFPEMIEFRDRFCDTEGLDLVVHKSQDHINDRADPFRLGTNKCCGLLKTKGLLDALSIHGFDAAIGGARRDEEKSRAKERMCSIRDRNGQWDPRCQRPELWNLFNCGLTDGQTMRLFPLSNWTELDIWEYILAQDVPVVDLYFAKRRPMITRGANLIAAEYYQGAFGGEIVENVMCRMRSLGCTYCSGAIRSEATTVVGIIDELRRARLSERQHRIIDHDGDNSMETKKREGYF
jgi:sulfate adenylyltransferase subunit 2